MTLQVFTARLGARDPDVLDVTRQSGREGLIFAPSWEILRPALAARRGAQAARADGLADVAEELEALAWERYVPLYIEEMRSASARGRSAEKKNAPPPLARQNKPIYSYPCERRGTPRGG